MQKDSNMYRDNTIHHNHYNVVLHRGGLGDFIAQLPAVKYILDNHKHIYVHLWCHDYAVDLAKVALVGYDNNLTIYSMSDYKTKYNDKLLARSPYAHKIANLSMHLTDHAFTSIVYKTVENKYKNYIKIDPIDVSHLNLPEKYVVITTGFTSDTREFLPQYVNGVSEYVLSEGYTPVYIGKSFTTSYLDHGIKGNFRANYDNGINLIDKTNILEAHAIMANSTVVVGLDNGLCHLACMSDVPVVFGFTTVDPEHRLPYRHGVKGWQTSTVTPTKEELSCIHCQSNMNFAPESHSFTKCYYGDYKCLELMSADKWIEQIEDRLT